MKIFVVSFFTTVELKKVHTVWLFDFNFYEYQIKKKRLIYFIDKSMMTGNTKSK